MKKFLRGPGFYILVLLLIVLMVQLFGSASNQEDRMISYDELMTLVKEGSVKEVLVTDRYLVGLKASDSAVKDDKLFPKQYDFSVDIPSRELFYLDLKAIKGAGDLNAADASSTLDFGFKVTYAEPAGVPWWSTLIPFVLMAVLLGVFWYFAMQQSQGANNKAMSFGKSRARMSVGNKNNVTFADVAGADEEKEELKEIVDFLKSPAKFTQVGARIPTGVLLVGPPGTGKTLLAKAVAGEAGVPFFSISGSDFVEMFVGVGASRVRDMFEQAKKNAPCILFIDEIDAVGRHRGAGLGGGHDEREQTLNQLLVEMDGFSTNEGIIVLAATNRPDILDPALLRPGRFDRQITVTAPDMKGREAILRVHARNKPLDPSVNLGVLAKRTPGFTGADLQNALNEAALLTARRSLRTITMNELEEAITRVMIGPEKKSRLITEEDKRCTAYHEVGHAVVSWTLPHCDPVHEVSIIPRGMAAGYTMTLPKEDQQHMTRGKLLDLVAELLGGRVAESLFLDDISTGAYNDLQRASAIARSMVVEYGMSEKVGPVYYGGEQQEVFLGRDFGHAKNYSEDLAAVIDEEVRAILENAYRTSTDILTQNRERVHQVAQILLEREKIDGEQFDNLMRGLDVDHRTAQPSPIEEGPAPEQPLAGDAPTEPQPEQPQ
ncbi:MAG: ATP-dependent zinc metalloprotease FtsH [Christensenellales bacterium]